MFKNHFPRTRQKKQNYSRFRGGRFGGGMKRVKTFDPSSIISVPTENYVEEVYVATNSFSDFQIDHKLKENIERKGYKTPTPIQDQSIAQILEGNDLIGIANTGTGKTAAFLIPLIDKVLKDRNQRVLIVTPTRELAVQIKDEFLDFSRSSLYRRIKHETSN
jgi:ATP-dependent RNA helicase RhlE